MLRQARERAPVTRAAHPGARKRQGCQTGRAHHGHLRVSGCAHTCDCVCARLPGAPRQVHSDLREHGLEKVRARLFVRGLCARACACPGADAEHGLEKVRMRLLARVGWRVVKGERRKTGAGADAEHGLARARACARVRVRLGARVRGRVPSGKETDGDVRGLVSS